MHASVHLSKLQGVCQLNLMLRSGNSALMEEGIRGGMRSPMPPVVM